MITYARYHFYMSDESRAISCEDVKYGLVPCWAGYHLSQISIVEEVYELVVHCSDILMSCCCVTFSVDVWQVDIAGEPEGRFFVSLHDIFDHGA